MSTDAVNLLTPLNILYLLAAILCLMFIVEVVIHVKHNKKISKWRPDITQMHYLIKTGTETCVPIFSYVEDNDIYTVEYKELLTGRFMLKRVVSAEEYANMPKMKAVDIEVSVLRIYIVTPTKHVLYRDFTRTNTDENYRPYAPKDISPNLLRVCADYFKRKCPKENNVSKVRDADIKYVEGLPYVDIGKAKRSV